MKTPAQRIAKRRADTPKAYRGIYDRAMTGQSKAAAIHAFCLECMGWQREEIKLCTAYACPLYPYHPFTSSQDAADGGDFALQSTNSPGGYQ